MTNGVGGGGDGVSSTHVAAAWGFICGAAVCVAVSKFRHRYKRELAELNALVQQKVGRLALAASVVLVSAVNLPYP